MHQSAVLLILLALSLGCQTQGGGSGNREPLSSLKDSQSKKDAEAFPPVKLNDWAKGLMDEAGESDASNSQVYGALARLGISDAEPLSIYTVNLRPGNDCFRESTPGLSLWWARNRSQVAQQIKEVVQFIEKYHHSIYGHPRGPFVIREVEICPKSTVKYEMGFSRGRLVIGVPYLMARGYHPWSAQELTTFWNEGLQLDPGAKVLSPSERSKLQKIWMLFDPVGDFRLKLRATYQSQSQTIASFLRTMPHTFSMELFKAEVWGKVVDPERLRIANEQALTKLWSLNQQTVLKNNWLCLVSAPATADDFAWGALSGVEQDLLSRQTNQLFSDGLGRMRADLQIGPRFTLANAPYEEYLRPANLAKSRNLGPKLQYELEKESLLHLHQLSAAATLATATFDRAVLATLDGNELCERRAKRL